MNQKLIFTILVVLTTYIIIHPQLSAQVNICELHDCQVQEDHIAFDQVVHQQGTQLYTPEKQPLQLHAVNLGGWLTWEGWIWGAGFESETKILNRLETLIGEVQTKQFQQQVYQTFITEADVQAIANQGFNTIRVPINHRFLENEQNWPIFDQFLTWCQTHDLYVIIDLHSAPGGQNKLFVSDPDKSKLWESNTNIEQTIYLWTKIAQRYKDNPTIAGYDLLNEPDSSDQQLLDLYLALITTIRAQGDPHLVILEGNNYAKDLSLFTKPLSRNQTYSFHMYTWLRDNREQKLKEYIQIAHPQSTPLWNGEFGENNVEMLTSTIDLFEQYQVNGYAFWTWKKVPNKYPHLVKIEPPSSWQPISDYLSTPFPWYNKPTPAQTEQALQDFLKATEFNQSNLNPELKTLFSNQS